MVRALLLVVCVLVAGCEARVAGSPAEEPSAPGGPGEPGDLPDSGPELGPDAGDGSDGGLPDAGGTPEEPLDGGVLPADAGVQGSAGCRGGTPLTSGEHTLTLGGTSRRFLLYLPQGYSPSRAWPVVFALHGNGGNVSYWNGTTGDRNLRGTLANDAILVITEAIGGNWRDYSQPASTWPARMELELAYFDELVARLTASLCVDEEELFAMGFSGGGSFSGVLGCRRSYIRAIAVGGSVVYFEPPSCVSTPATWSTMGQLELDERGTEFRDYFLGAAACAATTQPTAPSPCVRYDGCAPRTPNHYCVHPGDHVWPSFGTAAAWQFFQQFVD